MHNLHYEMCSWNISRLDPKKICREICVKPSMIGVHSCGIAGMRYLFYSLHPSNLVTPSIPVHPYITGGTLPPKHHASNHTKTRSCTGNQYHHKICIRKTVATCSQLNDFPPYHEYEWIDELLRHKLPTTSVRQKCVKRKCSTPLLNCSTEIKFVRVQRLFVKLFTC